MNVGDIGFADLEVLEYALYGADGMDFITKERAVLRGAVSKCRSGVIRLAADTNSLGPCKLTDGQRKRINDMILFRRDNGLGHELLNDVDVFFQLSLLCLIYVVQLSLICLQF